MVTRDATSRRRRVAVGLTAAVAATPIVMGGTRVVHVITSSRGGLGLHLASLGQAWRATVLDPYYWAFLAGLSLAQLVFPARRDQRKPSQALAEDAMWFALSTLLVVTVVAALLTPLGIAVRVVTARHQLDLTPYLGRWGVAVFAFVLVDLLAWFTHWLHHHVPRLWFFHAVHHSQANLNVLSDNRQHVVETFVTAVVAYLPARLLGLSTPDAIRLASFTIYWSAFIHANIRTDLGPLRHVLVSPQAHRVHHSVSAADFNTNYGTVFMFWDVLFRTRHRDHRSYPATGIADPKFPHALGRRPSSLAAMWVHQTVYPFQQALGRHPAGKQA